MSAETTTQSGRGGLIAAVLFFFAAIGAGAWIGFGGSAVNDAASVPAAPAPAQSTAVLQEASEPATAVAPDTNPEVKTALAEVANVTPEPEQSDDAQSRVDQGDEAQGAAAAVESKEAADQDVAAPAPAADANAPAPAALPAETAEAQVQPEEAPAAAEQAPSFDEIRREEDGTTVIAGQAAPGATVTVKVDGAAVATVRADRSGSFAAISNVPGTAAPQVMTLETENDTVSKEEIILAPLAPLPAAEPETPPQVQSEAPQTDIATAGAASSTAAPQPVPERALEPAPRVALLRSDARGVALASPPAPSAMSRVALDTIGYDALGEVQLSGRAQSEAREVRIYLNNKAVVSLPVGADGRWQGDLPNVDEGVYTLRVDEVRADGSVSSRVETPFQRESATVLANAQRDADGNIIAITVQKGNTLWAIARERYGEGTLYVKVFEANKNAIRDPDLIYPGQVFDLPK